MFALFRCGLRSPCGLCFHREGFVLLLVVIVMATATMLWFSASCQELACFCFLLDSLWASADSHGLLLIQMGFCCFVWASAASAWASAALFVLLLLRVSFCCLVWASVASCGLLWLRVGFCCFCVGLLVFLNATSIESRARVPFEGHYEAHGKLPFDKHHPKQCSLDPRSAFHFEIQRACLFFC